MVNVSREVHAAIGGWAIEYKPLLSPAAFDELERRVMALLAAERERCATIAHSIGTQQIETARRDAAFDVEIAIRDLDQR